MPLWKTRDCDGCGATCCQRFVIAMPLDQEKWRFYEYHGVGMEEKGGMMELTFEMPCKQLHGERCRIYADRPYTCRHFVCDKS